MEQLFAGLAGEGTTESSGLGFTLESDKAREKLQQFALAQPENYQLLVLAGLHALGCRHFELTVDADDFRVSAEQPLDREPFGNLWSFVSRGSEDATVIGCRLLAMGILTSVRLDEMEWSLESQDAAGAWRFRAVVRRGLLRESPLQGLDGSVPGLRLWARRRKASQIAKRFVSRLFGLGRTNFDEELIRRRVLLPREASLSCNGHSLLAPRVASTKVLASLSTGEAPDLVEAPMMERLDRDYDITVLLCRPESELPKEPVEAGNEALPGELNHAVWVWNGLRMDATVLGGELDCFRALVWAPSLRPDLSFSSLVDNRDKQALERNVRAMARELLDRWVRSVSPRISESTATLGAFADERELIRHAVLHRLDLTRDWKRLASLNRALSEFPLLLGSGPDGVRRWVSLLEIRSELDAGRPVAAFARSEQPPEVPAWHDRPLVLYTTPAEREFLGKRFSSWKLGSGEAVIEQLGRLNLVDAQAHPGPGPGRKEPLLEGQAEVEGATLDWWFYPFVPGAQREPAELLVRRPDGTSFADKGLLLPAGFQGRVSADWTPTFRGDLMDKALRGRLSLALAVEICRALVKRYAKRPPTADEAALVGAMLSLKDRSWEGELLTLPWLLICDTNGEHRRCSAVDLMEKLGRLDAPLYAQPWSEEVAEGTGGPWNEALILRAPRGAFRAAERLVGRPVVGAEALLLARRNRPYGAESPAKPLWSGELAAEQLTSLSTSAGRMIMDIFPRRRVKTNCRLLESLHGFPMPPRPVKEGYPGVDLAIDWRLGWPDSKGERRWATSDDLDETLLVSKGSLLLARDFFAQASAEQQLEVSPDLVATMLFDLLSEPAYAGERLLLTAAGQKIAIAEIEGKDGLASYFEEKAQRPVSGGMENAVYLPVPLRETMEMLCDWRWVRADEPVAAKTNATRAAAGKAVVTQGGEARPAQGTAPLPAPPPSPAPPSPPTSAEPSPPPVVPPPTVLPSVPEELPPGPKAEVEAQGETEAEALWIEGDFASERLANLVRTWSAAGGAGSYPHQHLFLSFLRTVREDDQQAQAVTERDGVVTLGAPTLRLLTRPHGAVYLLSALFSQFNRLYSEVDDSAERQFHASLWPHALKTTPR